MEGTVKLLIFENHCNKQPYMLLSYWLFCVVINCGKKSVIHVIQSWAWAHGCCTCSWKWQIQWLLSLYLVGAACTQ